MEPNKIWQFPNFLTKMQCDQLIELSETRDFQPAQVDLGSETKLVTGIRNNLRVSYSDPTLAKSLYLKVSALIPDAIDNWKPICLSSEFRFYKYEIGQRFKKHKDGVTKVDGLESRITLLIYLNDDFEGGETQFEDITIQPITGMATCFLHLLKHESTPIITGTKYVLRTNILGKID